LRTRLTKATKDVLGVLFLMLVVALMVDQAGPSSIHVRNIEMAVLCMLAAASYVFLRTFQRAVPPGTSSSRVAAFCGVLFAVGFLCGLSRCLTDGLEWSDVALIVPALLGMYCLKHALARRPRVGSIHTADPKGTSA